MVGGRVAHRCKPPAFQFRISDFMTIEELRERISKPSCSRNNRKTFAEMLASSREEHPTKNARHKTDEHKLQVSCLRWFYAQYPSTIIYATPNAGKRNERLGRYMKDEGLLAGVADLTILAQRGGFGALFIEMKTKTGRQTDTQRRFEEGVTKAGYRYCLCRSLEDFIRIVNEYMDLPCHT